MLPLRALAAALAALALAALAPPASAAAVMNADPCNATDANQQWHINATHGAASHQLAVTAGGAERCAAVSVAGADCAVADFAFVSTAGCAPAACASAQAFDVLEAATRLPAPAGRACAKCVVRSRLNASLCFGVGAELGGVEWKVSAADAATGRQRLEMVGAPLCLASGFEPSAYPISLQECEYL